MSSGRGRGVSNAPAWMSRQNREPGGGGPSGTSPPDNKRGRSPSPERDAYGRLRPMRRSPPSYDRRGGPPPQHYRGRGPPRFRDGGRPPYNRGGGGRPNRGNKTGIVFNSLAEEREWVEERRRKRLARKTLFDVPPTPEQVAADAKAAAMSNFAATDFSGASFPPGGGGGQITTQPQQTRHARRLYIGHLPPDLTEDQVHGFFGQAIAEALGDRRPAEDPILSVYINHERRFCFLEFKTVEMTTACLTLDGINVMGRGKVKVKRPNDYNPAMAPEIPHNAIPTLDVSRLGIVSGTVPDGPNKIFIGGLHYHLSEDQVLELLQAFGKVRAFHLVKEDPDSFTSKGYCFVEYTDPNVTQVAVMGLNGMDLGGGKTLTARVAAARNAVAAPQAVMGAPASANPNIINGYNVEALLDAAMGLAPMPAPPVVDPMSGMPVTPITITNTPVGAAAPPPMMAPTMGMAQPPAPMMAANNASALDIANAALEAAFGGPGTAAPQQQQQPPMAGAPMMGMMPPQQPQQQQHATRILVLLNMVTDEDLATNEDYEALVEEVREECSKFGKLVSMKIPRVQDGYEPTAIRKIFLEYATSNDAASAERELAGRTFGPNVVEASYFNEEEYLAGRLR